MSKQYNNFRRVKSIDQFNDHNQISKNYYMSRGVQKSIPKFDQYIKNQSHIQQKSFNIRSKFTKHQDCNQSRFDSPQHSVIKSASQKNIIYDDIIVKKNDQFYIPNSGPPFMQIDSITNKPKINLTKSMNKLQEVKGEIFYYKCRSMLIEQKQSYLLKKPKTKDLDHEQFYENMKTIDLIEQIPSMDALKYTIREQHIMNDDNLINNTYNKNKVPFKLDAVVNYRLDCAQHEFYYFSLTPNGLNYPIKFSSMQLGNKKDIEIESISKETQFRFFVSEKCTFPGAFNAEYQFKTKSWRISGDSKQATTVLLFICLVSDNDCTISFQIKFGAPNSPDFSITRRAQTNQNENSFSRISAPNFTMQLEAIKKSNLLKSQYIKNGEHYNIIQKNKDNLQNDKKPSIPLFEKILMVQQQKKSNNFNALEQVKRKIFSKNLKHIFHEINQGQADKLKTRYALRYHWIKLIYTTLYVELIKVAQLRKQNQIKQSYTVAVMLRGIAKKTAKVIDSVAPSLFDRMKLDIKMTTEMFVNNIQAKHLSTIMKIITPFLLKVGLANNLKSKLLIYHGKVKLIYRAMRSHHQRMKYYMLLMHKLQQKYLSKAFQLCLRQIDDDEQENRYLEWIGRLERDQTFRMRVETIIVDCLIKERIREFKSSTVSYKVSLQIYHNKKKLQFKVRAMIAMHGTHVPKQGEHIDLAYQIQKQAVVEGLLDLPIHPRLFMVINIMSIVQILPSVIDFTMKNQ